MTNELEKQFFNTFGIEPIEFKSCDVGTFCPYPEKECGTDTCPYYRTYKIDYPQITDTHYLKLICILSKELRMIFRITSENLEDLKKEILQKSISNYYCYSDELAPNHQWFYEYKHQVQALFEEG